MTKLCVQYFGFTFWPTLYIALCRFQRRF